MKLISGINEGFIDGKRYEKRAKISLVSMIRSAYVSHPRSSTV